MAKNLTGQEHAQEALDFLAESKALVERADKASDPTWRAAYSAQAAACAQIAEAELQAARLALEVLVVMPKVELGESDIKQWRKAAGVR
ncbi:hypothetical protein B0I32_106203 [Nonomuraea fuscirosea]|uniref:Uncharacterized protein n=1 Tax=Nonomuraea fuscirosea TaxID=1291556 RepID=A0A2T0N297_9ACTN|nr:hypothetical protein [Nonomuraea fuscirosea]PRX66067.1 hypothetical protein B0I32_106203 [Nonomuraea fuscirosea]